MTMRADDPRYVVLTAEEGDRLDRAVEACGGAQALCDEAKVRAVSTYYRARARGPVSTYVADALIGAADRVLKVAV